MTEEDVIRIVTPLIEKAKEQVLLALPELSAKLTMERLSVAKSVEELYRDNPTWKEHTSIVQSAIEDIDAANPGLSHAEIVKKAKPEITQRMNQIGSMDMNNVDKPNRPKFTSNIGEI